MSLNIICVGLDFIICTTDRRVTTFGTQTVMTERSAKLLVLHCADAAALITYNGIGTYAGKTPCDWLQELDARVGLARLAFLDALKEIQNDVQARIQSLSGISDRRHSFVIGAVVNERPPGVFVISNYESAKECNVATTARPEFGSTYAAIRRDLKPEDPKPAIVIPTGSTEAIDWRSVQAIGQKIQEGASAYAVKALCVNAIRDAALGKKSSSAIGSSVLWAILDNKTRGVEGGLDVIGGTTLHELPWMITPLCQMKEISFSAEKMIPGEAPCPRCHQLVPIGYRICGSCKKTIIE